MLWITNPHATSKVLQVQPDLLRASSSQLQGDAGLRPADLFTLLRLNVIASLIKAALVRPS